MPEITTLGEVMAEAAEDFLPSSVLPNDSDVSGAKIKDALEALLAAVGAISYPVTTVFGRLGNVVAAAADYAASQVANDSSVAGSTTKDALNALLAAIAAIPPAPVSTVFGRIGTVIAATSDYAASQIDNDSSVAGARVSNALNTLASAILAIPPAPVSTVFGRIGAVIATAADYAASQVANDSSVSGANVKLALNALLAAIPSVPVSSVFGRIGAVVAAASDYAASQISNDSSVTGATVKLALEALSTALTAHTSSTSNPHSVTKAQVGLTNVTDDAQLKRAANDFSSFTHKATPVTGDIVLVEDSAASGVKKYATLAEAIAFHTGNVSNPHSVTKAQVGLTNVTDDAQLKRADNDWSGFSTQSGSPAAGDKFLIERASDNGKRVMLAASLGSVYSSRDPIWDRPTTGTADDDEWDVDTVASGVWTFTTGGGVTMVRDGAVDLTQACATNHYRSSVVGSTLLLQIRQNESVFLHKQVAAALSSHQIWMLGLGFPSEPGTGNASDPTVSMGLYKGSAGALDFGNRATIRVTSSLERVETVCNVAAGGTALVATNSFTLTALDGIAVRINHGSAAAGNACGFAFRRSGTTAGWLQFNSAQYNLSTDRVGINLVSNSAGTPAGAVNAIFALHFLRRAPAAGGIAQA